ncbi:MAG: hypothetical protein HYS98_08535 [Deltaproteobacteria bacterium]|nr:hypothetical protein [Deltaproteobacteria bacterium]
MSGRFQDLREQLSQSERVAIEDALRQCKGNKARAAQLCGIPRSQLYKKIQDFNINLDAILTTH